MQHNQFKMKFDRMISQVSLAILALFLSASVVMASSAPAGGRRFILRHPFRVLPRGGSSAAAVGDKDQASSLLEASLSKSNDFGDEFELGDKDLVSTKPAKKPRRFSLFGGTRSGSNETQATPEKEPEEPKKSKKKNKKQARKTKTSEPEPEEPAKESTNSTATQQQHNVIILGGAPQQQPPQSPNSYRVIRNSSPTGPSSPPMRLTDNRSALYADLLTALVRLGTRIWFFLWVTRMATEHESIKPVQRFVWERLNDRYTKDESVLKQVLEEPPFGIGQFRWRQEHHWKVVQRYRAPAPALRETFNRTVVVVPLPMDNGNLNLAYLSDVITFLIQQYRHRAFGMIKDGNKNNKGGQPMPLEVVLLVKSGGGSVSQYGLATAQIQRLASEVGISLTVSVDQAAASGGYMIASQAQYLIAAPFATLGSVGVMMEAFNVRDLARNYGINPVSLKAGKYKNTVSMFGELTSSDEKHENERLKQVHTQFQEVVIASRPMLADRMDLLEGQVFLGSEALNLGLVDDIKTSEEYIMERVLAGDRVLRLHPSKMQQHRRLVQLSPLDLLPHLKSWISKRVASTTPETMASFLLSLGTAWGFASHVYQQFMNHQRSME